MKRFYRTVDVAAGGQGFAVTLDGRPIRTPGKLAFAVPYRPLAEAVAGEWRGQGEIVKIADMRITRFANTALDCVAGSREMTIRQVAAFGETDLFCYRATEPDGLVRRQQELWDPLLDWLAETHGARLAVFDGVTPGRQAPAALLAIAAAVARFESFPLTALHMAATSSGSVVVALALAAGRLDAAGAADAAQLDDMWQLERWGADAEAERRIASVRADIDAAARFFALCRNDADVSRA